MIDSDGLTLASRDAHRRWSPVGWRRREPGISWLSLPVLAVLLLAPAAARAQFMEETPPPRPSPPPRPQPPVEPSPLAPSTTPRRAAPSQQQPQPAPATSFPVGPPAQPRALPSSPAQSPPPSPAGPAW